MEPQVVFLTAHLNKGFKSHLKQLGIDDVYEKPLIVEQLEQIIDKVE